MKPPPATPAPWHARAATIFSGFFGAFLGLCLLKFGNPPIMEKWVNRPSELFEFVAITPWPIEWAYALLAVVVVAGLLIAHGKRTAPLWLVLMPSLWLAWQLVAATRSVSPELSNATLKHQVACVACFYLGLFCLSRVQRLWPFWLGLLTAFLMVLAIGIDQHFSGLEEARRFFYRELYAHPGTEAPPEFLKRMASNRIYSTLFYPNALAGLVLLLLPPLVVAATEMRDQFQHSDRARLPVLALLLGATLACVFLYLMSSTPAWLLCVVVALLVLFPAPKPILAATLAAAALACLFWSGSKGGWLLLLLLGLLALLRMPWQRRFKIALVTLLIVAGIAGFIARYAGFFHRGATSVSARFDYWRAAGQTALEHPLVGTGPGTFAIPYQKIKRPESEMSRLVHNDYLEQASDSGIPAFVAYTILIVGGLIWTFPKTGQGLQASAGTTAPTRKEEPKAARRVSNSDDWLVFTVWLGVLGWSVQGLLEFGLYLPSLAWPAFALLGWLVGQRSTIHQPNARSRSADSAT